jgi:hypothetical protein
MKKPKIYCPACLEVYHKATRDEYVSICSIIYQQFLDGHSNYENYTIVPSHCENYEKCTIWRESKEKDWERKYGERYSSVSQGEAIRL